MAESVSPATPWRNLKKSRNPQIYGSMPRLFVRACLIVAHLNCRSRCTGLTTRRNPKPRSTAVFAARPQDDQANR